MKQPQVIVFDLGKVLVDFDYNISAQRIAKRGTLHPNAVKDFFDNSPLLLEFETGEISSQQFYQGIREQTKYQGTYDEFCNVFADIFTPIDPMIAFHGRLREAGYPTFIFSNTNEIAILHIRQNFSFFSQFNHYIYSYEHGVMKPDPLLYEIVESKTGCSGETILYFDDRLENIQTGLERGWQAVHHLNSENAEGYGAQFNLFSCNP